MCVLLPRTSINAPCHFFMQFLHLHSSIFPSTQMDVYIDALAGSPWFLLTEMLMIIIIIITFWIKSPMKHCLPDRLILDLLVVELIENKRLDCTTIRSYRGQKIFDTSHDWLHDYFSLHCCCLFMYRVPLLSGASRGNVVRALWKYCGAHITSRCWIEWRWRQCEKK